MTQEDRSTPLAENSILASLTDEEVRGLAPHFEPVSLKLSEVLFRPEEHIKYAYFPLSCIVSLLTDLEDGTGMEVGLVGREGMAGISAILGGSSTKIATVQRAGDAARIRTDVLREKFAKGGQLQISLLRYTHALMTQISQSVVCNVRHPIEGRLARWLLMFSDRAGTNDFDLTQEFMAHMLGVRRPGVSEAASKLQALNLIQYQRGHITIIDRAGLENFACECYPVVKAKFTESNLLPDS